jgi:formylglycine-generating enzyme required for sulfatase activity
VAGNVTEWVADWLDAKYYDHSPEQNPQGPSNGDRKVLRGGSWIKPVSLRTAARDSVTGRPKQRHRLPLREGASVAARYAKAPAVVRSPPRECGVLERQPWAGVYLVRIQTN